MPHPCHLHQSSFSCLCKSHGSSASVTLRGRDASTVRPCRSWLAYKVSGTCTGLRKHNVTMATKLKQIFPMRTEELHWVLWKLTSFILLSPLFGDKTSIKEPSIARSSIWYSECSPQGTRVFPSAREVMGRFSKPETLEECILPRTGFPPG